MTRVYRYHLPAASMAAVVVRRRAAHAASDVKRIPVAHEDTSGEPCFVRARTERVKGNRQSADHGASLVLELDLPAHSASWRGQYRFRAMVMV